MHKINLERKNEYKMGVIGGMGAKSTSYFLDEVFDKTVANCDQDHINLICLNHSTLPDRTKLILQNEDEPLVSMMRNDVEILMKLGVEFIAIPCNTVFHFMDKVKDGFDINIISIVDETAKFIFENYKDCKRVGILGTLGTKESGIYEKALKTYGIEVSYPNEQAQRFVSEVIYTEVKEAGTSNSFERLMHLTNEIINEKHCDLVVLGCTELSYARKSKELPKFCIDALDCLVRSSILLSGKKYNT